MRLARKLFLLAATAIAALALSATTASAQITVTGEVPAQGCGTVTLGGLNGHEVIGGCHIEYETEEHIPLVAYVPNPLVVSNCNVHLEAKIGTTGAGYVEEAELTNEDPPTNPPCTRAPCDEDSGAGSEMIPWPIQIVESGAGDESVEATFCLRTIASGEGGAGSQCEVHLPLTQLGHLQEIGDHVEYFCETAPVPTSIQGVHFINEDPSAERIEIIH